MIENVANTTTLCQSHKKKPDNPTGLNTCVKSGVIINIDSFRVIPFTLLELF